MSKLSMVTAAILSLLVLGPTVPVIPAGMNQHFVSDCYAVESKLSAGDFDGAAKLAERLPTQNIVIGWDGGSVPKQFQADFRQSEQKAIAEWQRIPGLKITEGPNPDIKFSFQEALPVPKGGALPAGASFDFSNDAPYLRVAIALYRESPPQSVSKQDVFNEVMFAIAQRIGLERTPHFFGATSRTDEHTITEVKLVPFEMTQAHAALDVANGLRALVAGHEKVPADKPALSLSRGSVDGLKGAEAEPLGFTIDVENKGDSELRLYVLPDCSCLAPAATPTVEPGQKGQIQVAVNTALYTGHLLHRLFVYSNDPGWPVAEIPVKMYVEPLYRFVREGPEVVPLTDAGADVDLYMILSNRVAFTPLTARVFGPKGTVQFHAWQGKLPFDAEDPDAEKKGYKYHLHIGPTPTSGVVPASLMIGTDFEAYRELRPYTFNLQRGIVAMPGQLYVGTVGSTPTHFSFLVGRPFAGFKITKVSTNSPFLSATYVSTRGDREYRVDLAYNGKAVFGDFGSMVNVYTDDPKQPVIPVSVRGTVQ